MKAVALIAALACGACKPAASSSSSQPPAEQNAVERYAGGLQADVKRAQQAKEQAEAANKKTEDAQNALKAAEGQ